MVGLTTCRPRRRRLAAPAGPLCAAAFAAAIGAESILAEGAAAGAEAAEFWAAAQRAGLRVKLVEAGAGAQNASGPEEAAAVLSGDVFYGRPLLRVPQRALLGPETVSDVGLRRELESLRALLAAAEGSSSASLEEDCRLLGLAYALIAESRDPASVFREWIDAVRLERAPPALELTERQQQALAGTTVEGLPAELERQRGLIESLAPRLAAFGKDPVSREEATWALSVIVRRAQHVQEMQGGGHFGAAPVSLRLVPVAALLRVPRHPDVAVAGLLEETPASAPGLDGPMLVQVARRDMRRGEAAFMWTGRFSSSELALRHGAVFPRNPTGVGGNVSLPQNWNPGANTPHNREFRKFNCTIAQAFEIRLSPKGWPGRMFVRCSRIAWFLGNGWYKPEYVDRIDLLDKWPPPVKYKHSEWLEWTQADQAVNRALMDFCGTMKTRLKESLSSAVAEDFRKSLDPVDSMLWRVRGEESKAFRECVSLAKSVSTSSG